MIRVSSNSMKPLQFTRRYGVTGEMVYKSIQGNRSKPEDTVIFECERLETPGSCLEFFFKTVEKVRESGHGDGIMMEAVGLRLEGHSSRFHLMWVRNTDTLYAIDTKDDTFVCAMGLPKK